MQANTGVGIVQQSIQGGPSGALQGDLTLRLPLFDGITLELPATITMTAAVSALAPDCSCLDAQGTVAAPLVLRLPLPDDQGSLDVDVALTADATLRMGIPGQHGLIQATGRATGPLGLTLDLPRSSGKLIASGTLDTPFTLTAVVPDGRAKLGLQGNLTGEVGLNVALPDGGRIDARAALDSRIQGVVFLPSGQLTLAASAPMHTTVHLIALPIPQTERALTLDIAVDGTAEVAVEIPERRVQVRTQFEATLPLAPLVALIRDEVARQIRVEYIDLRPPTLLGAHDLELRLYVEARKGVLAKVDVTAHLRIDPRGKQIELQSIRAQGRNAAGSIIGSFFLNPRLFRPLRHTCLFDPATMLPPGMRVETLAFKDGAQGAIVIAADLAFEQRV